MNAACATTTREAVRCLEYECDEEETIRALARLGADLAEHHQISRITVVHRLGKVPVGEARVVIVVAAAHRKPAFAAAMEAMDRLKSDVAIWKKEYFEDGAVRAEETVERCATSFAPRVNVILERLFRNEQSRDSGIRRRHLRPLCGTSRTLRPLAAPKLRFS